MAKTSSRRFAICHRLVKLASPNLVRMRLARIGDLRINRYHSVIDLAVSVQGDRTLPR